MFTRRQFAAPSLGAAAAFLQQARGQTAKKPNVLMIAVDDLNDWVGCLGGHPGARTPNLDLLAARGLLFTNAHCAAPLCNPSRAAIMTGIRPSTSGVYDNGQPWRKSPALRGATTLPQHLRANGYYVAGAGKIFHGGYPDAPSWDAYFPNQRKTKPSDPVPVKQPANGIPGSGNMDWGPLSEPDSKMGDYQVVDWISEQLHHKHRNPFFLACGLFRPHLPWHVPAKYFDMFPLGDIVLPRIKPDDLDDVPPIGRKFARPEGDHKRITGAGKWREAVQAYLASIAFMDAQLGRLIDAFDHSPAGKDGKTIVTLWSDHGWHLGEKLHWRKFSLWEESTRNVFLTIAPGVTQPGTRCARPVSMMDFYPTMNELCGVAPRTELEGESLLPLMRNPALEWERGAVCTYFRNNHSVRTGRWRYTRYADGGEELYDHKADPEEWTNLAGSAEYATVKTHLARRWLPRVNAPDSVHERGLAEE